MSETDIVRRIKGIFKKEMEYEMGIREICKSYKAKEGKKKK
jgi:hypothetical protein